MNRAQQLIEQVMNGVDPVSLLSEVTSDFTKMSKQQMKDALEMYNDAIDTNKSMGRPAKQEWLDNRAKVQALLSGNQVDVGVHSNLVFGHPQATNILPRVYGNLVPIVVRKRSDVVKYLDKVQKLIDQLQSKIGRAEAVAKGKTGTPAKKKEAQKYLSSMEHTEESTVLDLLRNETARELERLLKLVK
jgi:hypothetical protein